jgi:hypothetical protein
MGSIDCCHYPCEELTNRRLTHRISSAEINAIHATGGLYHAPGSSRRALTTSRQLHLSSPAMITSPRTAVAHRAPGCSCRALARNSADMRISAAHAVSAYQPSPTITEPRPGSRPGPGFRHKRTTRAHRTEFVQECLPRCGGRQAASI